MLGQGWPHRGHHPAMWMLLAGVAVGTFQSPPVPRCTHLSGTSMGLVGGRLKHFISPQPAPCFVGSLSSVLEPNSQIICVGDKKLLEAT